MCRDINPDVETAITTTHHRASGWFAAVMAGLGAFLLEILIWRYARSLEPVLSITMLQYMIIFSQLWGMAGSILVVTAAWLLTSSASGILWKYVYPALPALVCVAGIVWLAGIATSVVVVFLQ